MTFTEEQLRVFGRQLIREFKIKEHEFFADFCVTYLLEHPQDHEALCRFLDGLTEAREARAQRPTRHGEEI